jgi:hypothetical protein
MINLVCVNNFVGINRYNYEIGNVYTYNTNEYIDMDIRYYAIYDSKLKLVGYLNSGYLNNFVLYSVWKKEYEYVTQMFDFFMDYEIKVKNKNGTE